jgi:hypothetical protein
MIIKTISDFRRVIRSGPYAWPGGYPLYFVTSDGGALSFKTAKEERSSILKAIQEGASSLWKSIGRMPRSTATIAANGSKALMQRMKQMSRPEMMLWLDDHRGVYIPRDFANSFRDRAKDVAGVTADDWTVLEAGPDHECYWDVWSDVLDCATVTDENGVIYRLHQDGALWLVPEGMEWNDATDMYDWPDDREPPDPPGWEGGFADNH